MKKMLTNWMATIMAVLMMAGTAVAATSSGTWGGIDWTLTADGVLTIKPTAGTPTQIANRPKQFEVGEWPEAVKYNSKGEGVAIEGWPYVRSNVKKLVIEEGVSKIGSFTAQGFSNLTGEVVIPSTVTYIGQEAFQKSTFTKLTFAAVPAGQTGAELCIAQGAFKNLIIEKVSLPADRPVHLHAWVFNNCHNLKNVTFPATITSVHGTNHIDYFKDFNAHSNPTWKKSSEIFAYDENLETITFGSKEVMDMFFANNNGTSKDYIKATAGLTAYGVLQDAIDAAQARDTITLIHNVTASEIITINKSITLDGNGKNLTSTAGRAINVATDGDVSIKNLTVNCTGERGINVITKPAKLTIEKCNITANNYAVNVASSAGAAQVAITGSTLTGLNVVNVAAKGAEVAITGGMITCNDQSDVENYAALALNPDAKNAKITASDVSFDIKGDSKKASNGAEGGEVIITGDSAGVSVAVASISYGDYAYTFTTLQDAIKFAQAGETIKLIRDVTASEIITINKAITLNGNGKKLTSTAGRAINVSGANGVTIKNLTINASGERAINIIQNATNVTIDNVTATAANYTVNVASSAPNAVVAIQNSTLNGLCTVNVSAAEAKVTVQDSTVNCNDNNTTAGEAYAALSLNKEAVGGSIVATNTTVNVATGSDSMKGRNGAENGTVTINGSTNGVAVMVAVITYQGSNAYHAFASLKSAIEFAKAGDTITLLADIDYGTDQLALAKAITLDLGGKTLTTRNAWGGMSIKGNATVKNGKIVHASNTAAIKVWNATAFEDLVIDVQGKGDANKTIGGIVLQSGSTTRVGSIKNVTIKGAALTNGIETYNCGDATENVIGSMENVTIDAQGTGMLISAPCGTATNCDIEGGVNGVEIWIKGNYSASLNLVNSKVEGGVYAHDEFSSNPDIVNNGKLSLTADENTTGAKVADVTLTINRAPAENVKGLLADIMGSAQAKVNGTYYASLSDALTAAQERETVYVFQGQYDQDLVINKPITVIGETTDTGYQLAEIYGQIQITADGATVKGFYVYDDDTAAYVHAKKVLIEGCELVGAGWAGLYQSYTDGTVTFKDSTIVGYTYGINFDGSEGGKIIIDNCKIQGWTSFASSINKVTIKDTEFAEGYENQLRFYQNAELINVTFNKEMTVDFGTNDVDASFTGCSVENGSLLDVISLGDIANMGVDVTIDGNPVVVVARYGDNYYTTLSEALAAAQGENVVIDLLADATLDITAWDTLAIGGDATKTITINGNNKTLTFNKLNSDWNHIVTKNNAKLILNDMTITDSGKNNGPWNRYDINFGCNVELNNVTSTKALAFKANATLNSVTINETADAYAIWIQSNGQDVAINGLTVASAGRGIKIDEQYVDDASQVKLSVKNAQFTTAKKAAIVVKSAAGANITLTDVDIDGVAADKVNAVWNDEDSVAYYGDITVSGGTLAQEGVGSVIEIETLADLKELDALVEGGNMLEGVTVKLMNDIDLYEMGTDGEPVTFNPIGANKKYFKGTFDGQGHTIKNMYQSGWALGYDWYNYGTIGLFAYVWNATVKNLTIENAECFVEGGNVAGIAGCAWGTCTFENITIKNSIYATYNNRAAGIVGYTGGEGNMTFKGVTVDKDTVIAGLWGSFDSSLGGLVGSIQNPTKFIFEDVTAKCRLDSYNDVTAAYKYYAYRMCGMLIGKIPVDDEKNQPILDNVTIRANVVIDYSNTPDYTYTNAGGSWKRVEAGYAYDGVDMTKYPNAEILYKPFNSIFGGQQYGSYGQDDHEDIITRGREAYFDGDYYSSLENAVKAADGAKDGEDNTIPVKLMANHSGDIVITESLKLELNGFNFDGEVTTDLEDYVVKGNDHNYVVTFNFTGSGTDTVPFEIANVDDLMRFSRLVNAGNDFDGMFVKLTADIDLTGKVWTPIGTSNYDKVPADAKKFAGSFDGDNHTITGLSSVGYVPAEEDTGSTEYSFGLFGYVYGADIKNVKFADVNIECGTRANSKGDNVYGSGNAALVGYYVPANNKTSVIENCHVLSGSVNASNNMGGLIGHMDSQKSQPEVNITIKDCSNAAAVTTEAREAGGILGLMNSAREGNYNVTMRGTVKFENCVNTGAITSHGGGAPSAGGILGRDHNQAAGQRLKIIFDGCRNSGTITVTANGETHAAGIGAGFYAAGAWLIAKNCENTGNVVVNGSGDVYAGGLISYGGVVELLNSTSTGTVTGGDGNKYVGSAHSILFLDGMNDYSDTVNGNTYYLNGGKSPEYSALVDDAAGGGNFHLVETASKEHFTFGGWYTNPELTGEACTALVKDRNRYYAKWTNWNPSGSGTLDDPFLISSVDELVAFRNSVNNGETTYNTPGVWVALGADIDMAGVNWVGIGSISQPHGFMGNFDGKTFKIKNLTITNPALDSDNYAYAGLFSITEGTDANNQNIIKNLTIENVTISTTGHIVSAAIAYPYYTAVENVNVCGAINITGGNYTAGALAYTRRCVNASNVSVVGNDGSTITGAQTVGGVISDIQMNGGLTANYSNFRAENLTITGTKQVGGISGIIATQTLNGATVKNVTIVCSDARVGQVAGAFGGTSTISNIVVENVTGATAVIGGTYDNGNPVQARVGDTYYATFVNALDAAKSGDTLTLLADIESTEVILLDKNLTINGDGHKVTSSATRVFRVTTANTDVTLNDVNMESTAVRVGTSDVRGISIDIVDNVKLTLNNCSVDFTDASANDWAYAVNVTGGSNHTLTVSGGTYEGANVVNARGANNTVVVKDATLNSMYPENNQYYGAAIWVEQNKGSSVEATGNTFNGSNAVAFNLGTGTTLAANNNTDNTSVCSAAAMAKIGNKGFPSFAAAIAAVQNGETITLVRDCDESVTIKQASGKSVTIDGNGKTYTGTITVDGDKRSAGTETLTIRNVNFVLSGEYQSGVFTVKNTYAHNLIVDRCSFTGNTTQSQYGYGIRLNHAYNVVITNTTGTNLIDLVYGQRAVTGLSVTDVTVNDSGMGFMLPYGKDLSFENVTVKSTSYPVAIYNNSSSIATFENCVFDRPIRLDEKVSGNSYTLTFNGTNNLPDKFVEVNGTTASLKVVVNDAGLEGKVANCTSLLAQVGNASYNSLQNAIAGAPTDSTVKLLRNIAHLENFAHVKNYDGYACFFSVANKSITVDLNGKMIEFTANNPNQFSAEKSGMLMAVFAVNEEAHLTLTDSSDSATGGVKCTAKNGEVVNKVYSLIAAYDNNSSWLTIEKGTYELDEALDSLIFSAPNKQVVVNGGQFTLGNVGDGTNGKPWIFNTLGANDWSLIVTGGTYNADVGSQYWKAEVSIPDPYCVKDNGNGTWIVTFRGKVKYIDPNGNATYEDTLKQTGNGYTIQLMTDLEVTEDANVVRAGNNVTLDLNGKNLTVADGKKVTASGVLTIVANGGSASGTIQPDGTEPFGEIAPTVIADSGITVAVPTGATQMTVDTDKTLTAFVLATVDGTNYNNIREAITAAMTSGKTLTLMADVKLSNALVVEAGQALTIDLGQKTLTGSIDGALITNNGTLTLTGGTVENTSTKAAAKEIVNAGQLTLNGTTAAVVTHAGEARVEKACNAGTIYCATLASAVSAAAAGDTVTLLKNASLESCVVIGQAITLDLNGKTVTATSKKAFEVTANATIKNGAIIAANRCVDTRTAVQLTLQDLTLTAVKTTFGNPQPLTIGGAEDGTIVTMTNVAIHADADVGYGIITFVKTQLTATNCTIGGYGALYVKPGSEESSFTFVKSSLKGSTGANDVAGNSFGVIAIEADTVAVAADADSTVTATGAHMYAISLGWTGDPTVENVDVAFLGTIAGNVLAMGTVGTNEIIVRDDYTDALEAAGFAAEAVIVEGEDGAFVKVAGEKVAEVNGVAYATLEKAFAAAQNGDEVRILKAGTYALTPSGKNITITGAVDGVIFDNIGAKNMNGASVTFNNVTFDYYPNKNYTGLQHAGTLVYNNCTFNGQVFLYGESETFNTCTFNQNSADAYNVWTYGAKDVAFNGCTFNSAGKSVLVYTETKTATNDVTVANCVFNASAPAEGKAAIEIDTSLTSGATVTITASTATGFANGNVSKNSLWNNKKGQMSDANNDITVVVDGTTVLQPVTFVAQLAPTKKYTSLNAAFAAAQAGDTVTLLSDVTLTEQIKIADKAVLANITFDGANKTITANMSKDNQSVLYFGDTSTGAWATGVTVKNVTIDGTARFALALMGGTSSTLENVTITGDYYYGINLYGTHGATMTDCDVVTLFTNGSDDYPLTLEDTTIGHLYANKSDRPDLEPNAKVFIKGTSTVAQLTFWGDVSTMIDPNTSDKIATVNDAVAEIGGVYYKSLDVAFAAAQSGDEVTILKAGTYALTTSGKNITITGAVDGVVFDNIGAKNMNGASVTFNDVTFDYYPNKNYTGLQHAGTLVYNNCTFNGQVFLYGESETFKNCTFNQDSADAYNVWTYGAAAVAFNGCTFNSAGKSVLVYTETKTATNDVTVANCVFKASASVAGKAAIEIDTSLSKGATVTITASTATGFATGNVSESSLWNNKKGQTTPANNDITVVVGGTTVLAPVTFVAKIGDVHYAALETAVAAAQAGQTVEVIADVTLTNAIEITNGMDVTITGTGKTVTGANGKDVFYVKGGKLTLAEGLNVHAPTDCAIYIRGGNVVTAANLTKAGTNYSVIQGNGNYAGNVTITGGKVETSDQLAAIYWPQNGKLTITGGEITGCTAVRIVSGALEITGGILTATGAQNAYAGANGGTAVDTGDALMIEAIGGASGYELISQITITGGTFISANAKPIGSYANTAQNPDATRLTGFVSGGLYDEAIDLDLCVAGLAPAVTTAGLYAIVEIPTAGLVAAGRGQVLEDVVIPGTVGDVVDEALMSVAVKFDKKASAGFANYLVDVNVTVTGLPAEGILCDDDDYLAGDFGPLGKLYIPLDGLTLKNGDVIPVLTTAGVTLPTYAEICAAANDVTCGITFGENNTCPGLTVSFQALLVENASATEGYVFGQAVTYDLTYAGAVVGLVRGDTLYYPYYSISEALADIQTLGVEDATIKFLIDPVAEKVAVPDGITAMIDLDGKTLNGSILAPNANLTIKNGTIKNADKGVSAVEINSGTLVLEKVDIDSARHAIRIDGPVVATINGGTYRSAIGEGKGTYHVLNVSGAAQVTVNGGTFIGPKGTVADSGSAVNVQSGATVTINGGRFSGGKKKTLASGGTLKVEGGIYDQNPTAYLTPGHMIYPTTDGTYQVLKVIKLDIQVVNGKPVIGYDETVTGTLVLKATSTLDGTITWTTISYSKDETLSAADSAKDWVKPADGYRFFMGGMNKGMTE